MKQSTDLFWSRVDQREPHECWPWGFSLNTNGYGRVIWNGRNQAVHRVAYELHTGQPVPTDLVLLHTCDVRACCNPEHLVLGTQEDNMFDLAMKGRWGTETVATIRIPAQRRREIREAYMVALFWAKVDVRGDDECWNWIAGQNDKGYGSVGFRGSVVGAHRASYILTNGDIPDNLCVMHACDNRLCVNPRHLSLGTRAENTWDMYRKGRSKIGNMPKGTRHHNSKLTDDDVRAIRAAKAAGVLQKDLCARYCVSASVVSEIVNRRAWVHVT